MKGMEGRKKRLLAGILALAMLCLGMAVSYGPVSPVSQRHSQEEAVLSWAQPATQEGLLAQETLQSADERKEEKSSTTSQLYALSAVLMDAGNGRILLEKNGSQILPMASTTKIMTCILTLELGNLEDVIPVSAYAAGQPKVHMGAVKGEYYRVGDLLYALMLESHNDAAVILAEYYGSRWAGLSLDCASHSGEESQRAVLAFAEKMNEKARKIGCQNTCYITPNGLDATLSRQEEGEEIQLEHSTTAADLALVMRYCAWQSPAAGSFLKITQTASYSFTNYVKADGGASFAAGGKSVSCTNHNAFLQMMDGAISGKTGFTGKAGYCYVGALEREGKSFVVALLACGWPNHKTWKWHDARLLLEYGLEQYEAKDLYQERALEPVAVLDGQWGQTGLEIARQKVQLLLGPEDEVEVKWELPQSLTAPVVKGEQVGRQLYYVNGELYAQIPITASESVPEITYFFCLRRVIRFTFL